MSAPGMAAPAPPPARDLLRGKTVVVTAAAGAGIGFAVARRAVEEGATVLLSDIHERRVAEAEAQLSRDAPGRVFACLCDVTDEAQVQRLRQVAVERLGHVDVLVNNAGLGGESEVVDMTDAQWARVLDVTLTSVFRMCRAFLPLMYAAKAGAVVNNASVLGWRAQRGQAHYAAAKAGVMAFTRCAAMEAAAHGVRINAVAPSIAMHPHLARVTTPELLETLARREAFGRTAETWEIANVILFLASDLASYMTGETVSVSSQHP